MARWSTDRFKYGFCVSKTFSFNANIFNNPQKNVQFFFLISILLLTMINFRYQIFFLIVTYAIPVVLMIACYTGMGRVLWGSRSIGEMTQRQVDSIKSKRKVVKGVLLIRIGCVPFLVNVSFVNTNIETLNE